MRGEYKNLCRKYGIFGVGSIKIVQKCKVILQGYYFAYYAPFCNFIIS